MKTKITLLVAGVFLAGLVNAFGQPTITAQPKSKATSLFGDVTFSVVASGTSDLSYQWQLNGMPIQGAVSRILTVSNVAKADVGSYTVAVSTAAGSVLSEAATLTIIPFSSMYCFGFSWTDTQAITHDCGSPTRCPSCYWQGRYSNGPMWPEFLSTSLGLAYAKDNNYAVCGASAEEIRAKVTNFRASAKPQLSAYFLWTEESINVPAPFTWDRANQVAILVNSNSVDRLYSKGARTIVIELSFDQTKVPGYVDEDGVDHARPSEFTASFNAGLIDALRASSKTRPDLRLVFVDIFSKLNDVVAHPAQYGFTKTAIDAQRDRSLSDKSLTGPGADYVFWDSFHPTSRLHELIATWHLEAIRSSILETLEATIVDGAPGIQMNRLLIGRDYTLQKSEELSSWADLHSFTASAGTNHWSTTAAESTDGYYRLKWQR